MPCPAGGGLCDGGLVHVHWPLYTVFPGCVILFYAAYFGAHPISNKYLKAYNDWSELNQRIWRQNICATVHSYLLVILLLIVVLRSHANLQAALLLPYYDPIAYCAISLSLGYMLLTLPWSARHWFGTKYERAATRPTLIVHHLFVVVAELVYLVTQTSPWHGALSFVLFEFSNLFLMPHHLMTQLNYRGKVHFWNGIGFFISCTLVRVAACTVLGVYYIRDVVSFQPTDELGVGVWVCVCLSLVSFWIILLLSCYWYVHDVLGEVHKEFKIAFGHDYWRFWRLCLAKHKPPPKTVSSSASRVERDQNSF